MLLHYHLEVVSVLNEYTQYITHKDQQHLYEIFVSRLNEATEELRRLRGPHADLRTEIFAMQTGSNAANSDLSLREILAPSTLRASGIAIILMLFQAFSGINAVMMYAVPILQASAPSANPIYCTIMLQAVQVLFNLFASSFTNKYGRKLPLTLSALGMSAALGGFSLYEIANLDGLSWIPVLCCATAVISFAIGFGPLAWLVVAEIAPVKVAGIVSTLATSTNWASNFILIRTFDNLITSLGSATVFGIYSIWCFLGAFFIVFILPETAGRSPQDILIILEGRGGPAKKERHLLRDSPKILLQNEQSVC